MCNYISHRFNTGADSTELDYLVKINQGKEINVGQQVPQRDFKDLQRSFRGFLGLQKTININIQVIIAIIASR